MQIDTDFFLEVCTKGAPEQVREMAKSAPKEFEFLQYMGICGAAEYGNVAVLEMLMNYGNHIVNMHDGGNEAIVLAVQGNHVEAAKVLLKNDADLTNVNRLRKSPIEFIRSEDMHFLFQTFDHYFTKEQKEWLNQSAGEWRKR